MSGEPMQKKSRNLLFIALILLCCLIYGAYESKSGRISSQTTAEGAGKQDAMNYVTAAPVKQVTATPTKKATATPTQRVTARPTQRATATPTPRPSYNTSFPTKTIQTLPGKQMIAVYSGPSTSYYRGANGKAEVSTNKSISVWGCENGWYLISYSLTAGGSRFGYIRDSDFNGSLSASNLYFAYKRTTVSRTVSLTDDPNGNQKTIVTLGKGASVTYLATYNSWYYVEYSTGGTRMRGFIPAGSLN